MPNSGNEALMQTLWSGTLSKMRVTDAPASGQAVTYHLTDATPDPAARASDLDLNPLVGRPVELRFTGTITCIACGRRIEKTFNQGFCFPCSQTRAEADICMVRPELCHYDDPDNPCRDPEFAQRECFQPHYLYCSLTSGIKIGITRLRNIPSRWIDQGAVAAIPLVVLPSRRDVGLIETRLSQHGFADRTHWTRMLRGNPPDDFDIVGAGRRILARLRAWNVEGILPAEERKLYRFVYPVRQWPERVNSLSLDKEPVVRGVLHGIKAQYLMLDTGVINIRKYSGYHVELSA